MYIYSDGDIIGKNLETSSSHGISHVDQIFPQCSMKPTGSMMKALVNGRNAQRATRVHVAMMISRGIFLGLFQSF